MKFRSQLLSTVLIQGVGALSVFGATVGLGWRFGPEAQGLFSRTKSELEFVSALAMIGMPQAVFYFANSGRMSRRSALHVSLATTIVALGAAAVYAAFSTIVRQGGIVLFAIAAAAIAAHAMLRVLVLADSGTAQFNTVTAAPQILLLVAVAVCIAGSFQSPLALLLVFAPPYLGAAWLASIILSRSATGRVPAAPTAARAIDLLAYGASAWSVSLLSTGATVLWLRTAETHAGPAALGVFSMGLTLVQVGLTPISYAAPLLFKHWMARPPTAATAMPIILGGVALLVGIIACVALAQFTALPKMLGAYADLYQLRWEFLTIVVAEVLIRSISVAANANGRPWTQAIAEIGRIAVLVGAIWSGTEMQVESVARIWALGAVVAAVSIAALVSIAWRVRRPAFP